MRATQLPLFALMILSGHCLLNEPMASVTMTSRIDGETTNQVLVDAFNMGFKTATRMTNKLFDSMMEKLGAVQAFDAKVEVENGPIDFNERNEALQHILDRNREALIDEPKEVAAEEAEQETQNNAQIYQNYENIENIGNIGNIENIENTENTENTENIENTENTESTENIENIENTENTENNENEDDIEYFPRVSGDVEYDAPNFEPATEILQRRPLTPEESTMLVREMMNDALDYPQEPVEKTREFPGFFRPLFPRPEPEIAPQNVEIRSETLRKLFGPRPDLRKIFLNINGELTPLSDLRVVRGGKEIPAMVSLAVNEETNDLNISLLN